MSQISNAEKQSRFRKKEQLKREADNMFRKWEMSVSRWRSKKAPEEVRDALEKAIQLPSGWSEENYLYALRKLGQYNTELQFSMDLIANDVNGDWTTQNVEFMKTPDPIKFIADNKAAIEKSRALSSHLISALKLSNCNDAEQAAALMEALRFVGRSLSSNRETHCSEAAVMCLLSIDSHYDRPAWFSEKLAKGISQRVGKSQANIVGQYLCKPGLP